MSNENELVSFKNPTLENTFFVITRNGVQVSDQMYPYPDQSLEEFIHTKKIAPKELIEFKAILKN